MYRRRKIGSRTAEVVAHLLSDPTADHYGWEVMKAVGMKSGALYPILRRLTDDQLLVKSSEPSPLEGRPARKVYRITSQQAEAELRAMLAEVA